MFVLGCLIFWVVGFVVFSGVSFVVFLIIGVGSFGDLFSLLKSLCFLSTFGKLIYLFIVISLVLEFIISSLVIVV